MIDGLRAAQSMRGSSSLDYVSSTPWKEERRKRLWS
jgi:hypothetical protein